jgi:hypothetical protein
MPLNIPLSPEVEARLRERAAAAGQDPAEYAARVLERSLSAPIPIADISGPIAEQFRASGMTEDQLAEALEAVKHEARAQRRRAAS